MASWENMRRWLANEIGGGPLSGALRQSPGALWGALNEGAFGPLNRGLGAIMEDDEAWRQAHPMFAQGRDAIDLMTMGAPGAMVGMIEKVSPASSIDDFGSIVREFSGDDDFLYHVTSEPVAKRILKEQALKAGKPLMGRGGNAEHSAGRVFLTERSGVPFWLEKTENHLFDMFDEPPKPVILRIPKSEAGDLIDDAIGTADAKARSYYSTRPVGKK